jgi:SAM-dependent methyltransferase
MAGQRATSGFDGGAPGVQRIITAMRTRDLPPDDVFDRYLPEELRPVSQQHWSTLRIAVRVARWAAEIHIGSILDIGSGAGKFCVAAALAGEARYVGLEYRPRLVEAARELARTFGVEDRVTFVEGAVGEVPFPEAEAYYAYNPFGEHLVGAQERLDDDVEFSRERFGRDRDALEDFFAGRPPGTVVFTYNGFGGHLPATYREMRCDRTTFSVLRMMRKTALPASTRGRRRG